MLHDMHGEIQEIMCNFPKDLKSGQMHARSLIINNAYRRTGFAFLWIA